MAGKGKPWDLTSVHALEGAAEWIRKRGDAIVVMVVRGQDFAFAVDERCAPSDAAELVRDLLEQMVEEANRARGKTRRPDQKTRGGDRRA